MSRVTDDARQRSSPFLATAWFGYRGRRIRHRQASGLRVCRSVGTKPRAVEDLKESMLFPLDVLLRIIQGLVLSESHPVLVKCFDSVMSPGAQGVVLNDITLKKRKGAQYR